MIDNGSKRSLIMPIAIEDNFHASVNVFGSDSR